MFKHVKTLVMKGFTVEYRGNSICDLKQVLKYPFKTNTPYQVHTARAKYNKQTKQLEGDTLYNDLNEAVAEFLKVCGVKQ